MAITLPILYRQGLAKTGAFPAFFAPMKGLNATRKAIFVALSAANATLMAVNAARKAIIAAL